MKISFKIPTIAALGGLVLCAGVLSASANGAASADKAAVIEHDGEYWSEEPTETKYYPEDAHKSEEAAVLPDSGTVGVTGTIDTERTVVEHDGGYWYFEEPSETHYYPENDHRSEGAAISEDGNIIGVTPNADPTSYNEESPYEAPNSSTIGIYRGDGRVYPCD